MPNDKANMGTAMDALVGTLKQTKLGKQNFGKNDSVIGSSIRHPGIAIDKAIEWLQQEMARVSGMPSGAQDEGSMYATGEMNPEARANSSLNMAGLAQVGSMPSAPVSKGGTLGTMINIDDNPGVSYRDIRANGMPSMPTGTNTDMLGSKVINSLVHDNPGVSYREMQGYQNPLDELMTTGSKKKPTPMTEFSQAHEIAQRNAALPVEQGGLGLPPDNTAMDRARAMGFDTEAFHGSQGNIESFSNDFLGTKTKALSASKAHFLTNNTDVANTYAKRSFISQGEKGYKEKQDLIRELNFLNRHGVQLNNSSKKLTKQERDILENTIKQQINNIGYVDGSIYPIMARLGKTKTHDYSNKNFRDRSFSSIIDDANLQGIDSSTFLNVNDVLSFLKSEQKKSNIYAILDPKNIRSRFAAFDPMKKDSANILASLLAGTAIAKSRKKDEKN